ncbi:MAG: MerR family transcriptional regulator [Acidimicrobiaceae bacterium]|jgi:MerR family transcriptional regulator, heat shock protein HspR|nr:MerR family transcriptional regulator [Acidimicrobiaceae bacterium]MDB4103278.1 MerR family transcriptional regulator [Acidimicrobiales bacterium]MDC0350015.1 MerR family transcriptional regulator [bacterium]MCO4833991.1 MerR family transcriptional regulator [Acidimicrobiaceae bacterium]MDC1390296.1 MerR family transcriptional regulator [Acidimicrobiales bacterium]
MTAGDERTRAVYIISVAAELTGVHPQTLRVYERKGLLAPARTGGMSRRYSEMDLEQIRRVQELTNEGLNLVGVARVLELEEQVERLRGRLEEITNTPGYSTALVRWRRTES